MKKQVKLENYLNKIEEPSSRMVMAKFRASDHELSIERGRFREIKREERVCPFCNTKPLENEEHFLFDCPLYDTHRNINFQDKK